MIQTSVKGAALNIYQLSERALTIEFGNEITDPILQRVSIFEKLIHKNPFPGFYTTVPAYATLTVFFDPIQVIASKLPGSTCFVKVSDYLNSLTDKVENEQKKDARTIAIPVCYGRDFGPDLDYLAQIHNITTDEVIRIHTEGIYKVYMIGFVPGFAYLGGMSSLLSTPRKETPRKAIPPGSVGIAGNQTGVYPLETPGGWQLIGRTPLKMFNAELSNPSLLKAGDNVVFEPIDEVEFNKLVAK